MCCQSPLPPEREPLLQEWLSVHGGETFYNPDGENRIVGCFGCSCPECLPLMRNFVTKAGIALHAQAADGVSVLRVNDHESKLEVRTRSVQEVSMESRIAELCLHLCLEVCQSAAEDIAKEVAIQVSRQVSQQIAERVARQVADGYAKGALRKQLQINSAFVEQAAMMNSPSSS